MVESVDENGGHTGHTSKKLAGKSLNMMTRERSKVVFLEEVVNAHAQEFGHETYVVSMVEPTEKVNAIAEDTLDE